MKAGGEDEWSATAKSKNPARECINTKTIFCLPNVAHVKAFGPLKYIAENDIAVSELTYKKQLAPYQKDQLSTYMDTVVRKRLGVIPDKVHFGGNFIRF